MGTRRRPRDEGEGGGGGGGGGADGDGAGKGEKNGKEKEKDAEGEDGGGEEDDPSVESGVFTPLPSTPAMTAHPHAGWPVRRFNSIGSAVSSMGEGGGLDLGEGGGGGEGNEDSRSLQLLERSTPADDAGGYRVSPSPLKRRRRSRHAPMWWRPLSPGSSHGGILTPPPSGTSLVLNVPNPNHSFTNPHFRDLASVWGGCEGLKPASWLHPSLPWANSDLEPMGKSMGHGSFSLVEVCRSRMDGWLYAVKRSKHRLASMTDLKQSMSEVLVLASLGDCPGLVRYYRSWVTDMHLYIQLELCPFGSLSEWTHDPSARKELGRPPWAEIEEPCGRLSLKCLELMVHSVATALDYMHEVAHVAHLDVKPANILLGRSGFKLCDFDRARSLEDRTIAPLDEGDSRYLSREVLAYEGRKIEDEATGDDKDGASESKYCWEGILRAADVHALGLSLFECISGSVLPPNGPEWEKLRSSPLPRVAFAKASPLHDLAQSMVCPYSTSPTASEIKRSIARISSTVP